jgi:predicted GIY-YIG superfamily endonuclease
MDKTNIYILKLQNNKYYIGKTNDINSRYKQHLCGSGSAWTKKYRPFIKHLLFMENIQQ